MYILSYTLSRPLFALGPFIHKHQVYTPTIRHINDYCFIELFLLILDKLKGEWKMQQYLFNNTIHALSHAAAVLRLTSRAWRFSCK